MAFFHFFRQVNLQIRQLRDRGSIGERRCCRGWIRICRSPPPPSSPPPSDHDRLLDGKDKTNKQTSARRIKEAHYLWLLCVSAVHQSDQHHCCRSLKEWGIILCVRRNELDGCGAAARGLMRILCRRESWLSLVPRIRSINSDPSQWSESHSLEGEVITAANREKMYHYRFSSIAKYHL